MRASKPRERVTMTTTAYIFTVEQFNPDRCKSTIRHERRFDTEQEAMRAFDEYDVANEFRIYTNTEGRASMEGSFLVASVIPATIDEDGWEECDPMDEIVSKEYRWADYIEA